MRIARLDLDRYGPFTDKSLIFRPDAKLHVVLGRNEAGKSCSLAALTDLLFGIERSTAYDFRHPAKDMQIGARIRNGKGEEIEFRRRKNKPALTDMGGRPLADDALAPYLGGLERKIFERAFGIDSLALRRSSEDLKHTDGELGAALFSAASGLRGLNDLKTSLETDADKLFAKTRSKDRAFYQASDRYEAARKRLREHEMRAGDLKKLQQDVDERAGARREIADRRAKIAAERSRLESLKRTAPMLREIDEKEARLAALGTLPAAVDGLGAQLVRAFEKLDSAAFARKEAESHDAKLQDRLETIVVDLTLLRRADEIERLATRLGEFQKGGRDLPGIERERDAAARLLDEFAARLGLPDAETLLGKRPDDASRARVADLAARGETLRLSREERLSGLEREQGSLEELERAREERGRLRDPRGLRERLSALDPLAALAEQTEKESAELASDAVTLSGAAARMSPPVAHFDSISRPAIPSREQIGAFAGAFAEADENHRACQHAIDTADEEVLRLESDLAALKAAGDVPSLERIAALRTERSAHWTAIRAHLFDAGAPLTPHDLASLTSAFETATDCADRVADAAISDAKRVAQHAVSSRRLEQQNALAARCKAAMTETIGARNALSDKWSLAWRESGIAPLSPADMGGWRMQIDALFERNAHLQARRAEIAVKQARTEASRPIFENLIAETGLSPMPALPLQDMARRISAETNRLAALWEAARASDTLIADLRARVARAAKNLEDANAAIAAWRLEFAAVLPRIGLPATASVSEAQAALAVWKDVPAAVAERDSLQRRAAGIQRDADDFRDKVRSLAAAAASDIGEAEPEVSLRILRQRLTEARDARTAREGVAKQRADALVSLGLAREAHHACAAQVSGLAEKAGRGAGLDIHASDLRAMGAGLSLRDEISAGLRTLREQLSHAADGRDERGLREALLDHDRDLANIMIAKLAEDYSALDRESQEAYAAEKEGRSKLVALEGATAAEEAEQQRVNAAAEMLEAARDWGVTSIGALLIGTAISRQRLGRQEPLMQRAGELFAGLTGGAFIGLGQGFDDHDVPHVIGRRASGGEIKAGEMSEGARDQLCLALRLAYVEDFAARSETPPFIGDDLFASFDDERTAFGLKALAAIGGTVQPILFTHHRFVAEAARRELGDAADVLELV